MARGQPLQASFAYGELSPRLRGRSDTERYRQSVETCENVITLSHGNAIKRPGLGLLEKSPTEGDIRLIELQANLLEPYVVELGWRTGSGGYLRVLDRDGYVLGGTQFVANPQFLDGLRFWNDNSDVGASVESLEPDYARFLPAGGTDQFTYPWAYVTSNGAPGSGQIYHQNAGGATNMRVHKTDALGQDRSVDLAKVNINDTITAAAQVWTVTSVTDNGTDIDFGITPGTQLTDASYDFTFDFVVPAADAKLTQQVTVATPAISHDALIRFFSNDPAFSGTLNVGTTEGASDIGSFVIANGDNTIPFTPGVATFWLSLEVDSTHAGFINVCDVCGLLESAAVLYEVATPWSDDDLERITTALSTQQVALYFAVETQPPQRLVVVAPGVFTFEPVPFTTQPAGWGIGNYPHAVTFYQQRLWYASTPTDPDTIWGSQTGDFLNFDLGTGLPAEAIEFEMSDRGVVEWIQGARDLLIGCDTAEYVLTSEGGVIIPGDVQLQQQSAYGCAHSQPVEVGNGVLYVGQDRRRIRFMNYQFLEDGWVSLDLTWPSEHVTAPLLRELHFLYAPDPLIWAVLFDGTMISAIYEREQNNLVGWHRHPSPAGDVQSIALTKIGSSTELWAAVRRETPLGGAVATYIEKTDALSLQVGEADELNILSDSAVRTNVTGTAEAPVAVGFDHLEGHTIQLLVQGSVHPPRTVVGGQVTLQPNFAKLGDIVVGGLAYTGRLYTLPLEGLNRTGTSQATMMRRNRIFTRLLNSALPVVNGITTGARFPATPMDEPEGQFTGDVLYTNLGWDREAQVQVEMPLPRVYNVLSLFGDAESNVL